MLRELKHKVGLFMVLVPVMLAGCFEPLGVKAEGSGQEVSIAGVSEEDAAEESFDAEEMIVTISGAGIITGEDANKPEAVVLNKEESNYIILTLQPGSETTFCRSFDGVKLTATFTGNEDGDECEYSWMASRISMDRAGHDKRLNGEYNGPAEWDAIFTESGYMGLHAVENDNVLSLSAPEGLSMNLNNSRVRLWADCYNKTKGRRYSLYTDLNLKIAKSDEKFRVKDIMVANMELDDKTKSNSADNPYILEIGQGEYIDWPIPSFSSGLCTNEIDDIAWISPHWLLYYRDPDMEDYRDAGNGDYCIWDNVNSYCESGNADAVYKERTQINLKGSVDFAGTTDFILRAVSPDDEYIYEYIKDSDVVEDHYGIYEEVYFRIVVKPITLSGIGIENYYFDDIEYEDGTDLCKVTSKDKPLELKFTKGCETAFNCDIYALLQAADGNPSYFAKAAPVWEVRGINAGIEDTLYCDYDGNGMVSGWNNYELFNGIHIAFDNKAGRSGDDYVTGPYKCVKFSFAGKPIATGEKTFKLTAYGRKPENGQRETKTAWFKIVIEDEAIKADTASIEGTAEIIPVYSEREYNDNRYEDLPLKYYQLNLEQGSGFSGVKFEATQGDAGGEYEWVITRDDIDDEQQILGGYKDNYFDGLFTNAGFNGIKASISGNTISFNSAAVGSYPNNIKMRLWLICRDKADAAAKPQVYKRDVLLSIVKEAEQIYKVDDIKVEGAELLKAGEANSPENPYLIYYEQGDYISGNGIPVSYGGKFSSKLYTTNGGNKNYASEEDGIYPYWAVYSFNDLDCEYSTFEAMPVFEFKGKDVSRTVDYMLRAYSPDCYQMIDPKDAYSNDDHPDAAYKNVFVRLAVKNAELSDITVSGVKNREGKDGSTAEKAIEIRLKAGEELEAGKIKFSAAMLNSKGKDIALAQDGEIYWYDDEGDGHAVPSTVYIHVPFWSVEGVTDPYFSGDEDMDYELYSGIKLVFGDTAEYINGYFLTGRPNERYISFTGKTELKGEKVFKVSALGNGVKKSLYFKLIVDDKGETEESEEPEDPGKKPSVWPEIKAGWYADYDTEISGSDIIIKKLKNDAKPGEYLVIPAKAEKDGKSYNVVLKGDMIWDARADKIKGIKIEKGVKALNMESASGLFEQMEALELLDITGLDTSGMTDMSDMFVGCKSLETLYLPTLVLDCEFDDVKAGLTALKTVYYTGTLEEWRETRCSIAETVKLILNYGTKDEAEAPAPGEADTAMTPVPVITTGTKELYLVKDQKFTLKNNDFESSDPSIISISKTGVFKVKKVTTGEPVLLTGKDGSRINVYVSKPVMQKSMKLKAGDKDQKPSFEYDNHLYVTWEIDNPDVATVDTNGNVTAIANGKTYVIAHVNGKIYKCKVVVSEAATPEERAIHLNVLKKKKVTVKGMKTPGWVSGNTDVVKINGTRFIAGGNPGKATVTSSDGKYKVRVYVEDPTIVSEGFTLRKGKYNITMKGGDIKRIKFKKLYRNVRFKSSKAENAFIDEDGYIRARKKGKAKLTAKINGKIVTINVTVQGDAPEPTVSVNSVMRTAL